MRALLIAIAGMLAVSTVNPASAEDVRLPSVTKERPIQAPLPIRVFNWTGVYLGGNFGGAWVHTDITVNVTGTVGSIQLPTTGQLSRGYRGRH